MLDNIELEREETFDLEYSLDDARISIKELTEKDLDSIVKQVVKFILNAKRKVKAETSFLIQGIDAGECNFNQIRLLTYLMAAKIEAILKFTEEDKNPNSNEYEFENGGLIIKFKVEEDADLIGEDPDCTNTEQPTGKYLFNCSVKVKGTWKKDAKTLAKAETRGIPVRSTRSKLNSVV